MANLHPDQQMAVSNKLTKKHTNGQNKDLISVFGTDQRELEHQPDLLCIIKKKNRKVKVVNFDKILASSFIKHTKIEKRIFFWTNI